MLLTFRKGTYALDALRFDQSQINHVTVNVTLLTPDWMTRVEAELSLMKANTAALFNATTNSLLGEDFSIPSMSFDADGKI